jgi:hypothetical protein
MLGSVSRLNFWGNRRCNREKEDWYRKKKDRQNGTSEKKLHANMEWLV